MTKIELTQAIVGTIVTIGSGKIVRRIIENNTHSSGIVDAITITVASFVIGGMISEKVKLHTDQKIESAFTWYKANVKETPQ